MKASVDGMLVAEAPDDRIIVVEGTATFRLTRLIIGVLQASPTPYTCPWKGQARYYDVLSTTGKCPDAAWCYPAPKHSAIDAVGHDFTSYVAFDAQQITVA
ncbi:DUF427 domain-containing protein [Kribbella sp. VKM Ac-2568]|uniref:DUF427 domain-containing protein n=1 Tax=Kribbella sp. VKM Ac-2568 TaxID=2512219 RepID=UPI001045C115|nr:DUF427 domain-containing protein [Kribbella sp. VKM Ac-2568]TCM37918.1 uncharacterized protein (DUF427 family) [Kribbella sp. VKM Ac-2568]